MKKQKGITLIALVISIIVMLILAGVSIDAIVGQNGILNKAKTATLNNKIATIREEIDLYKTSQIMGQVKGLNIYPILKEDNSLVSMTTKFNNGSLSLADLSTELKNYLIKRIGSKNTDIIANINDTNLYGDYYFIDESLIPSIKDMKNDLALYIYDDNNYDLIFFDGISWNEDGSKSYVLSVTDKTSMDEELKNMATYYAVGNNTYKLYASGNLKVVGEKTENISTRLNEVQTEALTKIDLVNITKTYSIPTTTVYSEGYDCIGINDSGNKVYVKQLLINQTKTGGACAYIIDMNNNLWAWGESSNNKFGLGITGRVEVPTLLLQGIKDSSNNQVKVKKVWGNYLNTVVLASDNNIWICGSNVGALLSQGDTADYNGWVQPKVFNNYDEYKNNESGIEIEKEILTLTGNFNGSKLEEIYVSSSSSEVNIIYVYENGDIYGGGAHGSGLGLGAPNANSSNYYIKLSDYWNEQLKLAMEDDTITTANIKYISVYASNTYIILDSGAVLCTGWEGSGGYGKPDSINKKSGYINRCIDFDENYIENGKNVKSREVILTDNNVYFTRTFLGDENNSAIEWYYKSLAVEAIPEDFDMSKANIIGSNFIVSNGELYNLSYYSQEVKFKMTKNTTINIGKVIFNDCINNNYSTAYNGKESESFIISNENYEFYGMSVDDIALSEEKNLYALTDIGISDVKYVSTYEDSVDILLENNFIIENLIGEPVNPGLSNNEYITKLVSNLGMKSILTNDGNGNRFLKLKGNKYLGCWGLSETNSPEAIQNIINNTPADKEVVYPALGLEDVNDFVYLQKNSEEIFENIKSIYTSTKYIGGWEENNVGSIILTNDGEVFWMGVHNVAGTSAARRVFLPKQDTSNTNSYRLGPYKYGSTDYPRLVQTDTLTEIGPNIKDIAFSDITIEAGLRLANTSILTNDGSVYVYGTDSQSNGIGSSMSDFVKLNLPEEIDKIYSAYGLSLAVSKTGNVYAWGYDYYKVTGLSNSYITTPQKLNISNVYYISCGKGFCIYACSDGKVYGIGKNNYGQLGTGNNVSTTTFVECTMLEQ